MEANVEHDPFDTFFPPLEILPGFQERSSRKQNIVINTIVEAMGHPLGLFKASPAILLGHPH